jgi:hypothetical protein
MRHRPAPRPPSPPKITQIQNDLSPSGHSPVGLFFCSNVACRNIQALNMVFRLSHWLNSCCMRWPAKSTKAVKR